MDAAARSSNRMERHPVPELMVESGGEDRHAKDRRVHERIRSRSDYPQNYRRRGSEQGDHDQNDEAFH